MIIIHYMTTFNNICIYLFADIRVIANSNEIPVLFLPIIRLIGT